MIFSVLDGAQIGPDGFENGNLPARSYVGRFELALGQEQGLSRRVEGRDDSLMSEGAWGGESISQTSSSSPYAVRLDLPLSKNSDKGKAQ